MTDGTEVQETKKQRRRRFKRLARAKAGVPAGMTWSDHKLYNQTRIGSLQKKMAANKFDADIKEHGLAEAMRMAGIEDDGT
jgi:hypothetical protein